MIIYAPNEHFTGLSASVPFVNGVGETDNTHLISWFISKGYRVEVPEIPDQPGEQGEQGEPEEPEEPETPEITEINGGVQIEPEESAEPEEPEQPANPTRKNKNKNAV